MKRLVLFAALMLCTAVILLSAQLCCAAAEIPEDETPAVEKEFSDAVLPDPQADYEPQLLSLGEFKITFYCCEKRKHICGTGDGLTATGQQVRPGLIAVDPSVIPLGSDVCLVFPGGEAIWFKAEDTGGSIKGSRIDIAVPTHDEALAYGVKWAEVYAYELPR